MFIYLSILQSRRHLQERKGQCGFTTFFLSVLLWFIHKEPHQYTKARTQKLFIAFHTRLLCLSFFRGGKGAGMLLPFFFLFSSIY